MVADNPEEKIKLKIHSKIINDHGTLESETESYKEPPVVTYVNQKPILENYLKIKKEVEELIELEIEILLNTPDCNLVFQILF